MSLEDRLLDVRHVALDLDGTVYCGDTAFPWTRPFLATLAELGIGRSFLTNNSSRSREEYVEHLRSFGVEAAVEDISSSSRAVADLLRADYPQVRRLFVLGTPGLCEELTHEGYSVGDGSAQDGAGDEPQAVVVGFDTTLTYERLCRAAYWIERGKPFLATHVDRVCPSEAATLLVDCGSLCACLESATGRPPVVAPGKPDAHLLRELMRRLVLAPGEIAMVGDRLYTDIRMARDAGVVSVLVLSGESTRDDASRSDDTPDLVVEHLGELGELLRRVRR